MLLFTAFAAIFACDTMVPNCQAFDLPDKSKLKYLWISYTLIKTVQMVCNGRKGGCFTQF